MPQVLSLEQDFPFVIRKSGHLSSILFVSLVLHHLSNAAPSAVAKKIIQAGSIFFLSVTGTGSQSFKEEVLSIWVISEMIGSAGEQEGVSAT